MIYYIKKHWKINLLVALLQLAYALTAVLPNLCMMQMAQGIIDRKLEVFLLWVAIEAAVWGMYLLLEYLRTRAKSRAVLEMNSHVRRDIAATLLKTGHQDFHASQSGQHLSRLTNDVNQIQTLAWDSFHGLISVAAQVAFSVIALGAIHWSLLVIAGVVSGVMLLVPKLAGSRMERLSQDYARIQGQSMGRLKELLAGMEVLRAFGRDSRFLEENGEASAELEQGRHHFTCTQTKLEMLVEAANVLCQITIGVVIGALSIQGVIIQSAIMGGGNIVGTVSSGLSGISQRLLAIKASKPYFDQITCRAEQAREVSCPPAEPLEEAITIEGLSFGYGDTPVLQNASFRFEKGGKYALTGPSGCGKSTLLKLLLGWLPEYQGSIRFDGTEARDFSAGQLQKQMSYIEQDVFLFNTTIRDNITLGEEFPEEKFRRVLEQSALAGDLAAMPLGLDTPVGEEGSSLSGGQKQRVAIARALIHDRSVLLVDEGTSALDEGNARIVEESLLRNPQLTLILVSHHLTAGRKAQFTQVYELREAS